MLGDVDVAATVPESGLPAALARAEAIGPVTLVAAVQGV